MTRSQLRGKKAKGALAQGPPRPASCLDTQTPGGRCKLQSTPGLVERPAQGRGWVSIPKEPQSGGGAGKPGQRHVH